MNSEELRKRRDDLLAKEANEPEGWWWLSFAAEDGFRGACVVRARGFLGATMIAHMLGISPGGEVKSLGPAPAHFEPEAGWANRLLTRAECEEFDRVHEARAEAAAS